VQFAGEGRYLELAAAEGFPVFALPEIPLDEYRVKTEKGEMNYLSRRQIIEFVRCEIELIRRLKTDLVIDTFRPTTYLSTRILKVRRMPLTLACVTRYYDEPLVIPETHFFSFLNYSRLSTAVASWFTKLGKQVLFWLHARDYRNILKYFEPCGRLSYEDLTNEGEKIMLYDFPEFGPLRDEPSGKYVYIGAPLYDLKVAAPVWLDQVIDLKKRSSLPVIYLSMGSTGLFYRQTLQALRNYSKQRQPLIVVGNTCTLMSTDEIVQAESDKIFLVDFAHADKLLSLTDIMVTHGGRGSLYHAMRYGVPIIGIPHQPEQEWNLRRIETLNLGRLVSRLAFSEKLLFTALDDLLENYENYRTEALRYADIITSYDPEKIVNSAVDQVLSA
jgi:UDP:flavonoid glycosyltransferase YjiC (YdhE family)